MSSTGSGVSALVAKAVEIDHNFMNSAETNSHFSFPSWPVFRNHFFQCISLASLV